MSADADHTVAMIRDSAQAIVPRNGSLKRARAQRFEPPGFSREVWRQMCDMGWLGLRIAEEKGGAGLGMEAFCAVCEELGKGLAPEPLISATMAMRLMPEDMRQPAIKGDLIILPAWQEQMGMLDAGTATRIEGDRISGTKRFVVQGGGADAFIVVTRSTAALVEPGGDGVSSETRKCQDGTFYATIKLDGAAGRTGPADGFQAAIDEATLGTAAYLLGVMSGAFDITLDYLRVRRQFDKPIGSFQALQHRAADLKIQIELTRASIGAAARAIDAGDRAQAMQKVSAAKARAAEAAMLVTSEGVQMHGAIGYTDEADIGLYLRKAMTLAGLYGSAAVHRHRYAALISGGARS